MKLQFAFIIAALFLTASAAYSETVVAGADGVEINIKDPSRIVTIGSDITEIVYELGVEKQLVGRDDTSDYPPAVNDLLSAGYMRTLAPEGLLSLNPSLILATDGSGPPATIEQIRNTGLPLVIIGKEYSHEGVINKIKLIAQCMNKEDAGKELIQSLEAQKTALDKSLQNMKSTPLILCLMSIQRGMLMAAGEKTGAHAVTKMIGAQNAVSGFESYKSLSTEVAVAAQPDVILIPSHAVDMIGGLEKIASMPELANTPAVKNKKIITMNSSYLLMFGPRYIYAAADLAQKIYPNFEMPEELTHKQIAE